MQSTKPSRTFVQLVLLWFALTLGCAVASPLVAPKAMTLICSGAGAIELVPLPDNDGPMLSAEHGTMDCSLCVNVGAPPPPLLSDTAPVPAPLAHALRAIPAARIAVLTAPPLPSRGPPHALR
ncbi:DUF2946 family protein [Curvibacter cyanobacteriorum]